MAALSLYEVISEAIAADIYMVDGRLKSAMLTCCHTFLSRRRAAHVDKGEHFATTQILAVGRLAFIAAGRLVARLFMGLQPCMSISWALAPRTSSFAYAGHGIGSDGMQMQPSHRFRAALGMATMLPGERCALAHRSSFFIGDITPKPFSCTAAPAIALRAFPHFQLQEMTRQPRCFRLPQGKCDISAGFGHFFIT